MAKQKPIKKKPIEQYEHKDKERVNNPPVGLVTPDTDPDVKSGMPRKTYQYDPHLDPQLVWAGKAEHTSFEVPTVSLHVHERIDPRTIIEAVRKKNGSNYEQMSLFSGKGENPPLREAIDFYKHRHNWSNRLIAGDSLLVMNSLLEKEGLGGQVQMIYIDPPYGIKYGSNFQPFVNKRDVKDGKDEDLTAEPEMVKAFRDTWELGIHSYLTYLRDRLLLARELLTENGSVFVQISDENVHHVKELMDEVFVQRNFCGIVSFRKTTGQAGFLLPDTNDYLLWYAHDRDKIKFRSLYLPREGAGWVNYDFVALPDGVHRKMTLDEKDDPSLLKKGSRIYRRSPLTSTSSSESTLVPVVFESQTYSPGTGGWKTNAEGFERLKAANRLEAYGSTLAYRRYADDFPYFPISNAWIDTASGGYGADKIYVVQTNQKVIQRCMLMTTDPGDLVLDPTCGSGTTAYVAEQWGRRWITCDTSRVATTLAKQRLTSAVFDYYELAHPDEGVGSGFIYKTVPHITLKSIANNEPPGQETLYDQPHTDNARTRVTGPFTVEAVPAPSVKPLEDVVRVADSLPEADATIARSGATLRQREWRDELLKSGIRGKNGQYILFSRVEPLSGTRWLHAEAETKPNEKGAMTVREPSHHSPLSTGHPQRVVISFGSEHAPLEQRQVELAWEEARSLVPRPSLLVFAAFQFDPEAAKDIDETDPAKAGMTFLKVQMNADMLTDDLKKKRTGGDSFWLIGQPDVRVVSEQWLVDRLGRRIAPYDDIKELSGVDSLAEINRLSPADLQLYTVLSQRRDLWIDLAVKESGGLDSQQHRRGTGKERHEGVHPVSGDSERLAGGSRNLVDIIRAFELRRKGSFREFVGRLRRNKQIAERFAQSPVHSPLTTCHCFTIHVLGFDYYNTRTGTIESGGNEKIAMWLLDTDYDGRSLFPRQVFFPMAGENEGWSRLARNLKAEIDEDLIEGYRGTVSLPFEPGKHKRIAVKIVDDRGIESLRVMEVE